MSSRRRASGHAPRRRLVRVIGSVLYWLAVILISLAVVVGLVLLLESRDASDIEGAADETSPDPAVALVEGSC